MWLLVLKVMLRCYAERFATKIFSATQLFNVGILLQPFETMLQRCIALKIVFANRLVYLKYDVNWLNTYTSNQNFVYLFVCLYILCGRNELIAE